MKEPLKPVNMTILNWSAYEDKINLTDPVRKKSNAVFLLGDSKYF